MKLAYIEKRFSTESMALITKMRDIVDTYVAEGYRLTARQLYYQLVAGAIIENTERSYKRVTGLINDAKMAGLMDWDDIEDRTRAFIRRGRWQSASALLEAAADQFHMDRWSNQDTRVFVIVEKEALVGVLQRLCNTYDVPLLAARGYPSGTVVHEFCREDLLSAMDVGQRAVVLHLGDHDPSGIDMTRDLTERINLFVGNNDDFQLFRIALTMEQVEEQKPPPNPAKQTDSRFRGYHRTYGRSSWELDALKPDYLNNLVRMHIERHIDEDKWGESAAEIKRRKTALKKVAKEFATQGI